MAASSASYLHPLVVELSEQWPQNRTINLVFHGHSVPAGYFATPFVDSFHAYPHLLHRRLKERFPFAVINAIVTAIGGETSDRGAVRFDDVLAHRPDVLFLDYALSDRRIGLFSSEKAYRSMIESACEHGAKMVLLGPSADKRGLYDPDDRRKLDAQNAQVRGLADEYNLGFADVLSLFDKAEVAGELDLVLSQQNHPNARGHALIADALLRYFPVPALRPSREHL